MKTLVEELKGRLGKDILGDLELKATIEDALLDLHKRYNITWSNRLGQETEVFNLACLLGAKVKGNKYLMYSLRFLPAPWVESLDVYETIGSGAPFAALLLKILSRAPASSGQTFADIEYGYNIWLAAHTINEIKEFDMYSGGTTNISVIRDKGYEEIPATRISEFYNRIVNLMSDQMIGVMSKNQEEARKVIRNMFPKG